MKKGFNLFILGLIMFLGCLVDVNAKSAAFENQEIFIHDWDTEDVLFYNEFNYYGNSKIYYEYGYITTDFNFTENLESGGTVLTKYDITGNVVKEESFDETVFLETQLVDDKIYALVFWPEDDGFAMGISVFDLDLELVDEYFLDTDGMANAFLSSTMDAKSYDLDIFSVDEDGTIYLLYFGAPLVVVIDEDGYDFLEGTRSVFKYFPYYEKMEEYAYDYNREFLGYKEKDNLEVLTGFTGCSIDFDGIPSISKGILDTGDACESFGLIALFDEEEEVWAEIYTEYRGIFNPVFTDEYIVAIGVTQDYGYEVIVLDMKGTLLQKIETDTEYFRLEGGDKSFMISTLEESDGTFCYTDVQEEHGLNVFGNVDVGIRSSCYTMNSEVWYIPLTIETKTDGNGTVTAVSSSRYGEDVAFTVTPKEGFVLGEVKVTDEFGNVVIFNDYHFTMPNANVVIDVTFLPENSETADIAIVALVVIALGTGVILLKNRKRLN